MQPRNQIFQLLALFIVAFTLAACSRGGGSGGTTSGSGSSSIEGTVTSASLALLPADRQKNGLLADLLRAMLPVTNAHADTGVGGIQVEAAGLRTTTNSSGYFRLDGVPPGTHQVTFRQNGQAVQTTVQVGANETVTMDNIRLENRQVYCQEIRHTPMANHDDADMGPHNSPGPASRGSHQ